METIRMNRKNLIRRNLANQRRAKTIPEGLADLSATHTLSELAEICEVDRRTMRSWLDDLDLTPARYERPTERRQKAEDAARDMVSMANRWR